ncbi:MAG: hypothetical protein ACP5NB_13450 [Chloroflexia bacterium]
MLGKLGWHPSKFKGFVECLVQRGILQEIEVAAVGQGRPACFLRLLAPGESLQRVLLGGGGENLYEALLRRHHSPEQVLMVLRTADLLQEWKYEVELLPASIALAPLPSFPAATCYPDLVASRDGERLLVEVELHPFGALGDPKERLPYHKDQERLRKWDIFFVAGGGTIAVVTPARRAEDTMRRELTLWFAYSPMLRAMREARRDVVVRLLLANCRSPGQGWSVYMLR